MNILNTLFLILSAHQTAGGEKAAIIAKEPIKVSESKTRNPIPQNHATWVTHDDYPSKALREELEGSSRIRVIVDKNGKVTNCTIVRSSGHSILDARTCELVSQRAQFRPALDTDGNATIGSYTQLITWAIPEVEDPQEKAEDFAYTADIILDDEGKTTSCQEHVIGYNSLGSVCTVGKTLPPKLLAMIDENLNASKKIKFIFLNYQKDNLIINSIANEPAEISLTLYDATIEVTPMGRLINCTENLNQTGENFCSDTQIGRQEYRPFDASGGNRKFRLLSKIIVPKDEDVKAVPTQ